VGAAGDGGSRGDDSTVLLVHGAHLAGWCWLLVVEQLARCGIRAHAVDLPFTGYVDDVRHVREEVAEAAGRGPVHLVGHSYAGLVIAAAGHEASHLTFVAGRLPRPGESAAAGTDDWSFPEFRACMVEGADGVVRLDPGARDLLYNRTAPALAEFAMSRARPMASVVPEDPIADPAWTSVPSSYVVCADDRAVRPDAQRERAALVGSAVELDTDHSPFFSGVRPLAGFLAAQHDRVAR
jgi:pimeloyl-ACP methyl ester carboxylesterase